MRSADEELGEIELDPNLAAQIASLRLRDGLELHEHQGYERDCYTILEDHTNHKFYRLGAQEANFFRLLQSQPELIETLLLQQSAKILSTEQALRFCQWLQHVGLTVGDSKKESPRPKTNVISNAFFLRVPLGSPDEPMRWIANHCGVLFSWHANWLAGLAVCIGLLIGVFHWGEFSESYADLFTASRGIWLAVIWVALKIVHEVAHGATCRFYGGRVHSAGLAFILFMPIAYVDVSSAWKFRSRMQRLHVTLAGVMAEMVIAAAAMVAWLFVESPTTRQFLADLVLAASATSLLFNLNPLLKFDGYFALADATGIDNLYQYGQSYARYFANRYILGIDQHPPQLPAKYRPGIKIYGVASALWRLVTVSGLLTGAAVMFAGAGVTLAIVGFVSFVVLPALRLGGTLVEQAEAGALSWTRLGLRLSIIVAATIGLSFVLPAQVRRTSPGIVEYDPPAVLRAPTDGFVEEILVNEGQHVTARQPILRLVSQDLGIKLQAVETRLAQAQLRARSARWNNDSSKLEEANAEIISQQKQLLELRSQAEQLIVRAPAAGCVAIRGLATLKGQYLDRGQEFGAIGSEDSKRVKVSIGKWEASRSEQWRELPARVSLPGALGSWTAAVGRVETRASEVPPDVSLTALGGGPLSVRDVGDAEEPMLIEPRVNAFIVLDQERSLQLRCGQRCSVRLGCWGQSLGGWLWESVVQLLPY